MKIFIPSKGRPDLISTHLLFPKAKIILHNNGEKKSYLLNKTILPESLIVADIPFGLTPMRRFIYEQVSQGEWYLMLDDNLIGITGVEAQEYAENETFPVKQNSSKSLKSVFEAAVSAERFLQICQEMIQKCEQQNIFHCGFATNKNYFFRPKKYRTVGWVIGKATLTKREDIEMNFDAEILSIDDYAHTAKHLLNHGKVLINDWIYPVKIHYQQGGIGAYPERIKDRLTDVQYLLNKYPNLFRIQEKPHYVSGTELRLRFTTEKQIEIWRQQMNQKIKEN